jgi:excisionase family DNA binding protein
MPEVITIDSARRLLYDRQEAARQLSISVRTIDYLTAARQLETRRIGKKVLITHASLVRYSQGNHYESPRELAAV